MVYKTNLPASALPKYLAKGTSTHMFGPERLLSETPVGPYQDVPVQMVDDRVLRRGVRRFETYKIDRLLLPLTQQIRRATVASNGRL